MDHMYMHDNGFDYLKALQPMRNITMIIQIRIMLRLSQQRHFS